MSDLQSETLKKKVAMIRSAIARFNHCYAMMVDTNVFVGIKEKKGDGFFSVFVPDLDKIEEACENLYKSRRHDKEIGATYFEDSETHEGWVMLQISEEAAIH